MRRVRLRIEGTVGSPIADLALFALKSGDFICEG
jgi:hypothetical protein